MPWPNKESCVMNGTKYLLDTNAVIALLAGNRSFEDKLSQAAWIGISAVTVIEFLSFSELSDKDKTSLEIFIKRVSVIGITNDFQNLESVSKFKVATKLKLPDALIGYAANENNATLISHDNHFQNINGLSVLQF